MISRAIVFESAMSEPTSSPSQRSAHCGRRRAPRIDDEEPRSVVDALEQVVEEDRVRLACVRAPEEDHVGLLDLCVRRRAAARSEHRRQTDDARGVSGSVTGVDVVRAHHLTGELPRQEVHLVRRLRAGEDAERRRACRPRVPGRSRRRRGRVPRPTWRYAERRPHGRAVSSGVLWSCARASPPVPVADC